MTRRVSALLVLALACVRVEAYTCASDDECASRAEGLCEANGYCSYPDPACESQRRYSGLAGPFADKCTEPEVGTSSSSGTTIDPSTSTPSSTGGAESSTDPIRVTGTGDVVEPGEPIWSFTRSGDAPGNDVFFDVVAISEESFVVAGHTNMPVTGRDALLVRYDGPEDVGWTVTRDHENGIDRAAGMVRGGDGALYLAGEFLGDEGYDAWMGRWDAQGNEEWVEILGGGQAADVVLGLGSVVVAVGRYGNLSGFTIARRTWNEVYWDHALPGTIEVRISAAASRGDELLIGGQLDHNGYLARVAQAGIEQLALFPDDGETFAEIQGIATTEDAIFVVGYVTELDTTYQGWIARFGLQGGDPMWERSRGEMLNDELESIAIGDEGQLYVTGFAGGAEDPDLWVAEWTQGGDEVWSRSYPELDMGEGKGRDIAVMPGGDLLVVGEVELEGGDFDAIALRIAP